MQISEISLIKLLKNCFKKLTSIQNLLKNMLDYCERYCEKENGKISVAFNYCYLEKVLIKKKRIDQELVIYI